MKGKNGLLQLQSGKKKKKKRSPETSPSLPPPLYTASLLTIISTIFSGGSSGNKPPWPTCPGPCLSLAKALSLTASFYLPCTISLSLSLSLSLIYLTVVPRDPWTSAFLQWHAPVRGVQTALKWRDIAPQQLKRWRGGACTARELANPSRHCTAATGHAHYHLKVPWSSIRSHDRNGTLGLRRKWPDFKTRFSR